MKIWLILKPSLESWIEASDRFWNLKVVNMWIQKIIQEEKLECFKDQKRDGINPTPFSQELLLKSNKNTGIILKLICRRITKTKGWKNIWIGNSCWVHKSIVWDIMISNRYIQLGQKMIKHHTLRKKLSNSNIEELLTSLKTTKGRTKEWWRPKKPDLQRLEPSNFCRIILKTPQNTKENISTLSSQKLWASIKIISRLIMTKLKLQLLIITKSSLQQCFRTGNSLTLITRVSRLSLYPNGMTSLDSGPMQSTLFLNSTR